MVNLNLFLRYEANLRFIHLGYLESNLIIFWGTKFLNTFNKISFKLWTFTSAVLLLKTTFQFTYEIAQCLHGGSVFLKSQTSKLGRWRKTYVKIKWSKYSIMMAFIINRLLDSNFREPFTISGKKEVYTWRLVICNMHWLTNHISVTQHFCKGIYFLPSFVIFIT